jgi:lipopolysaccharide export system protein LptA
MRNILLILIFVTSILFAQNLEIISKFFKYDPKEKVSVFKGDVNATKGEDNILADEMYVYFDNNKKPVKFVAIGNVKFVLALDKNSTYKGKCDKLIYFIKSGDIILKGNAFVKKLETNESISGDIIKMNRFTKDISVQGAKKPVNIIIKVD